MRVGDDKRDLELMKEIQDDFNKELDKIVDKICKVLKTFARCITAIACTWIAGYMILGIIKLLKG